MNKIVHEYIKGIFTKSNTSDILSNPDNWFVIENEIVVKDMVKLSLFFGHDYYPAHVVYYNDSKFYYKKENEYIELEELNSTFNEYLNNMNK